jgi:hypothetical protein
VTRHSARGQQPKPKKKREKSITVLPKKPLSTLTVTCNLQENHYACWFAKQKQYQQLLKHKAGRQLTTGDREMNVLELGTN